MTMPERERQAVQLVADGHTYPTAALEMHVSLTTIQSYLERARWRLNARNTTHAVAIAYRQGQIT